MNLIDLKFTKTPEVKQHKKAEHSLVIVESEYDTPELEGAKVKIVMTEENAHALSVQIQQLLQDRDTAREEAKQQETNAQWPPEGESHTSPRVVRYRYDRAGKPEVF